MSFLEFQLDPNITKGARSTIQWKRDKAYTGAGFLSQDFKWANAKHLMDVGYRSRQRSEYDPLLDLFYVLFHNGHGGFRAKNWSDFELTQANSILVFVSGSDWQICRKHLAGGAQYLRPVKKPVIDGTMTIWRNGSEEASATVDETTGIATISGHTPGDTYTAVGEFDYPVTFESDEWVTNLEGTAADLWLSPEPIVLEEIRIR